MTENAASPGAAPTKLWQDILLNQGDLDGIANASPLATDGIDLAKISEEVRSRSASVSKRAQELALLRDEFADIFISVDKVLDEAAKNNSSLIDKTAVLARKEEEHKQLNSRYLTLSAEHDQIFHDNALLRSQVERFTTMISGREARINELEASLNRSRDEAAGFRKDLEKLRPAYASSEEHLQEAREQLHRQETAIAQYGVHITELTDRCSLAELQGAAFEKRLIESQSTVNGLRDSLTNGEKRYDETLQRLNQANELISTLQGKVSAAETAVAATKVATNVAESLWLERKQSMREEIARLNEVIGVEGSRAEAAESQLRGLRVELQGAAAQLRAKDRDIDQLVTKCTPLEERLESAQREIAALSGQVVNGEKSRAALADKAQAMMRAITDLKSKLELAEQRGKQLEDRIASNTALASTDREQLAKKVRTLGEELEKERAEHRVAANAPETSRSKLADYRTANGIHDARGQLERLSSRALQLDENAPDRTINPPRSSEWAKLSDAAERIKTQQAATKPLISKLNALPRQAPPEEEH
jgi:chromosome segregation ATPase